MTPAITLTVREHGPSQNTLVCVIMTDDTDGPVTACQRFVTAEVAKEEYPIGRTLTLAPEDEWDALQAVVRGQHDEITALQQEVEALRVENAARKETPRKRTKKTGEGA